MENSDYKVEWLRRPVPVYEREQEEVQEKLRNEAETKEQMMKEREEKYKKKYPKIIYPIFRPYLNE